MRTAGSRKYDCRKGIKQEAPLKVIPTGGAESEGSILNLDKGEKIHVEALQVNLKL